LNYFVTSGCSFANETNTWSVHLKNDLINKSICHNYGSGGAGVDWTRRSIMNGVLELIEKGVPTKDIKVIVSWPWRNEWEQPVYLSEGETEKLQESITKHGTEYRISHTQYDKIGFKLNSDITKYLFKYLVSYDKKTWWTRCGNHRYDDLIKNLHRYRADNYDLGLQFMDYYESILSLQMFLETNSIHYTFFAVKNIQRITTFETWEKSFVWDDKSEFIKKLKCDCGECTQAVNEGWKGQHKRIISPKLIDKEFVYEKYPFLKLIYNQIKWENWWSYKSDVNDFGGTSECIAEQCDIFEYHNNMGDILIGHPNNHAWKSWYDKFLKPHLIKIGMIK
jgi:hypothetical protein